MFSLQVYGGSRNSRSEVIGKSLVEIRVSRVVAGKFELLDLTVIWVGVYFGIVGARDPGIATPARQ